MRRFKSYIKLFGSNLMLWSSFLVRTFAWIICQFYGDLHYQNNYLEPVRRLCNSGGNTCCNWYAITGQRFALFTSGGNTNCCNWYASTGQRFVHCLQSSENFKFVRAAVCEKILWGCLIWTEGNTIVRGTITNLQGNSL